MKIVKCSCIKKTQIKFGKRIKGFTLSVWSRARYKIECVIMKCSMGNLPSSLKPFIKRELKNKYKQMCENKIKSFNENSKMFLYKKLKLNLEREFYLPYNNSDIRRGFTSCSII
jgi:hypothetical protein